MKRMNGAGTRALQTIREFTVAQRTIALIGVAVFALGAIALGNWLLQPSYQPLYTGLDASDASAVVAQLEKDKVPYQLDGTGTILVPAADVSQERLASAAAGLPSNTDSGYALLDKLGVTASEFQQNVTYKRAIEGELAQTIESIQGVTNASVLLAIPQQTVFSDNTQNPTASVTLNVTSPLTSQQVQAITHLVSASYPGLTESNVTVVDQKGDLLSSDGGAGGAQDAATYEATTQAAVQAMLDRVLGPGNATVTVNADVSSSSGSTTKTQYSTPTSAPVVSESTNDSTYTGSGAASAASGVLGTDTTDTSGTTTTGSGTGSTYKQTQGAKQNAVDEQTTTQSIVPGTLNRQTIAVAVSSTALTKSALSATALQTMVQNAAGYNPTRGDLISVTPVAFSNASAAAAKAALAQETQAAQADQMSRIIQAAILVVGGLVGMILFFILVKKLFKRQEPMPMEAGVVNVMPMNPGVDPAFGGHQLGGAGAAGALGYGGQQHGLPPTMAMPQQQLGGAGAFSQMQADVDALAGSDPERTAEYLRALMADGSRV